MTAGACLRACVTAGACLRVCVTPGARCAVMTPRPPRPPALLTPVLVLELLLVARLAHVHADLAVLGHRPLEEDAEAEVVAVRRELPEHARAVVVRRNAHLQRPNLRSLYSAARGLVIGTGVPAGLGKGRGAKEIGHNLVSRERPKFGHNLR